jgi:hypothetical protein
VIGWRLLGLTFGEIADREGVTKQAAENAERTGLRKLGVGRSLAAVVHADRRAGFRRAGLEHLAATHPVHRGTTRRPERWEREHERRVAEFFTGCGA